ncbi:MAG: GGDEF domain-containing protein [Arcobacteraceae bacterium]|nr:GGDEF domain-containing protein [Arcobacteraceae bacterium]
MNSKYIIVCIDSDSVILSILESKISRIIDSNYVVNTYTTAEEALLNSFENIANGYEILMTICSYDLPNITGEEFIVDFFKNSPYTKNVIFKPDLNIDIISNILNNASLYRIIDKNLDKCNFELMILETIKVYDQERRLRDYQNVLEDAVDKRTKELKDTNIKLHILATTDSLTGVKNRRSFFDSSNSMIPYIRREKHFMGVLMIDIDKFKLINDNYGHAMGDEALKLVSSELHKIVRKSDIFGRIGGEEFAVTLPHTSLDGTLLVAEKMRKAIEKLSFNNNDGVNIPLRVSIGVSMLIDSDISLEDILQRADIALYKAKQSGRNQVIHIKDV